MTRSLTLISAVALLASFASAQCFNTTLGNLAPNSAGAPGVGDDVDFDVVPLNFNFPINGSLSSFTHAQVSTNGVIYLTTGGPGATSVFAYPSLADLQGLAGQAPRIAPFWVDLDFLPANNGGVFINNPAGGPLTVTWRNAQEWGQPWPVYTIQAQLFSNGNVVYVYGGNTATTLEAMTGISAGNAIAATPEVDLSAGGNTVTTDFIYEQQPVGVFDLGGRSLTFTRNAGGGYTQTGGNCVNAFHRKYGAGCYTRSDSFYQFFTDSSTVPAALNGQSLVMTLVGTDYLVQWGGATYFAPTAAALTLPSSDDSETTVLPVLPLPTPAGPQGTLFIHSNGMISAASNSGIQPQNYTPNATGFLDAPATAFFSWHDYNTSEAGSGQIKYEEATTAAGVIAYVTWDNVENYSTPLGPNPSTLQFQLNLSTGDVAIVWVTLDGNNTSGFGSAHLIGYSTVGPSSDPGSINLATTPPFLTSITNLTAMDLQASPAPVSSASLGTAVVYSTTDIPEFAPGVYIGLTAFSLGQIPGGQDLGIIGAAGCNAYIPTLDFTLTMIGFASSNSVTLNLPAGIPAVPIYAQSVALIQPGSLNAFGLTVSNGIVSQIAPF